jgi:replicative DNA helicase Mcm
MEVTEQIRKYVEFFNTYYKAELLEKVRKGEKFAIIDFSNLSMFDPELANLLLDSPEDLIKAAEIGIEQMELQGDIKSFKVRFENLPASQRMMIREIRSKHMGKFLWFEGIVRQKSDVRPQVTTARFECPSCGDVISVLQLDTQFREPTRCKCGRQGKFRLLSRELVDFQGLVLEEAPENLEGGEQPKRMNVLLRDDLVSPMSEKRTSPGNKIKVTGIVKEEPIILRSGAKSTTLNLLIEANNVKASDESFLDVLISEEEEKEILKLAEDPKVYDKMVNSIAPSIYGHTQIKEALVLQLFGGLQKTRPDGAISRGDIHVLLVGDPGGGKSQMLKRINVVAPKARYISGKGISAAGLTASVVKDEFLKGWSLEAGAMVLASNGICCIDEMDKMSTEDTAAMHEALENQTVSISKANIQATLVARTTVLAAANPKFGRFDPYEILAKQINLPPTLINRFDLIFPIKDLPNVEKDTQLAGHILNLHQNPNIQDPEIPTKFIRKYIAYAKQRCRPKLTDSAIEKIQSYYIHMRNKTDTDEATFKAIPISPRQLEALVRISEAYAKVRLSDKVTKKDAENAIKLLAYCMSEVGVDPDTGKIDIDLLATGVAASQRTHILEVKEIITELEGKVGKTISIDDILKEAAARGIEDDKVEEVIEKLKRSGDIFEPRRGVIQKL